MLKFKHLASTVLLLLLLISVAFLAFDLTLPRHRNSDEILKLESQVQDNPFCFAVAGDPHIGKSASSHSVFTSAIRDINSRNYEFLAVNGDLTDNGKFDEFAEYIGLVEDSNVPVVSAVGNHDIRSDTAVYREMFGKSYFSFTYEDYQFIVLDNADKSISSEQVDWLKTQLEKDSYNVVLTHIPLLAAEASFHDDFHNAEQVLDVIDENKPAVVIASHTHEYLSFSSDGVDYIITDDAGAGKVSSYVSICADGGEFEHEVVPLEN